MKETKKKVLRQRIKSLRAQARLARKKRLKEVAEGIAPAK
jgi:hypothetical protein